MDMHKIKIIDVTQEEQFFKKFLKHKKKHEKILKINDNLFEIALRKGLIEKNENDYYFIGDYGELLAFKTKSPSKSFEWLV
jgi:hypothetical protein